MLSEVEKAEIARAFQLIADLAPTLGESELRVLIELTKRFAGNEHKSGRISSRQLSDATKLSRSNVRNALTSLRSRHLIAAREGTATEASGYGLTYLRIRKMGGPATGPPPTGSTYQGGPVTNPPLDLSHTQGGLFSDPPLDFSQAQGGPFSGPPTSDQEHAQGLAGARVDFDSSDSKEVLDRLFSANPSQHDPAEIAYLKKWVHGYHSQFARDKNPHPPDPAILAQLLTMAPLTRIIRLIEDLMAERKEPGHSYAWYVTVAAQRIHGIRPQELKAKRAALRLVKRHNSDDEFTDSRAFVSELKEHIRMASRGIK